MNAKMLITGVAVAVLAAGAASAQTDPSSGSMGSTSQPAAGAASTDMSSTHAMSHHTMRHRHHAMRAMHEGREGGSYAAPQQPIPYADLGKYEKASPRHRIAMEQHANTGGVADTAATSPANGSNMGAAGADTGAMQQQGGQSSAPDASMGSTATPRTDGTGAMDTNPPVNGATTGAADQMPTAGMGHNGSDATGTPAAGTPNQSSGPTPH
jgi:hypothetical protein